MEKKLISIVVPMHNEEKNIPLFYSELKETIRPLDYLFEIIFVDDGSTDGTATGLRRITESDPDVKVIQFSRNFGKEAATTAGLDHCQGAACLLMDGDLQHPVRLIPEFLEKWGNGAELVVGVRTKNIGEGFSKKIGSFLFYKTINKISETEITPHATDYRLLDRMVIDEFRRLKERSRMTRALIDWLGFKRDYIYFQAQERIHGNPGYSYLKLVKLAGSSYIAHSLLPLKLAGYLGVGITLLSGILGLIMLLDRFLLKDSWMFNFSGPAMLATMILFMVGIVLICLGLIALYIGNIHVEVANRPIYVIKKRWNFN
jgi:glycosyltransferase involved in cell wall biosynthesis